MNRLHHSDFVALIASIYQPKIYLELGLYEGETFNKVRRVSPNSRCVGVDINELSLGGEIYICTTEKFFEKFNGNADMVFIDADHKYESALEDFENSLRILNPGGCILMHDTDPEKDFLFDSGYCGDSYRLVEHFESRGDVNIVTLPCTEAGISIITRKDETRTQRRRKR